MKKICVFLGANFGNHHQFNESVIELGQELANRDLTLIYGGGGLGLMGLLAKTVKEQGGKAIGIITKQLIDKEKPPNTLDELFIVESMQERKQLMQQMADVFVVMPGGLGTLEEAFEVWNAIKIGILEKRIGFLNINGYFDDLFAFISNCEHSGLLLKKDADIAVVQPGVQSLLTHLLTPIYATASV